MVETPRVDIVAIGESIFKSLLWDNWVTMAETKVLAVLALSGTGPLGILVCWLCGLFADSIYQGIILFIDVTAIKLKNEKLQTDYDREASKLYIMAHDQGIESDEFKKERQLRKKALADPGHFNI